MWQLKIQTTDGGWHHFETFDGTSKEFAGVDVRRAAHNWGLRLIKEGHCVDFRVEQTGG